MLKHSKQNLPSFLAKSAIFSSIEIQCLIAGKFKFCCIWVDWCADNIPRALFEILTVGVFFLNALSIIT